MDLQTAKNISERTDKPLEEILYLPIGKEIILRRGNMPIWTERYDILKNKNYQKIFEKNAENPDLIDRETL